MTRPLPDIVLDTIEFVLTLGIMAWVTIMPSIGLLWILGVLS